MLLSITTTHRPATDLGFLLHKNPDSLRTVSVSFGKAHVFFPEATEKRCTATLLLDIDPVGLVRARGKRSGAHSLYSYVNDRPYVASSFLSVAIAKVYGTTLSGRCRDKPELADAELPLIARLTAVPDRSGGELLQRLFEPLGYELNAQQLALDERFTEWGESSLFNVELKRKCRIADLLTHLYVLIPVLDNRKHYWVGSDEVRKLLRRGEGWLADHPERNQITRRYLRHKRSLTRAALTRLVADETPSIDEAEDDQEDSETAPAKKLSLGEQRRNAIVTALLESGAKRVLDLGCGEGTLLQRLMEERQFTEIAGLDVSHRALEKAQRWLRLERLSPERRERVKLWHGSLVYRDARLSGFDAAAVAEVIEHLDPSRLASFERVVFEYAHPGTVVLTTPNIEYNVKFESLTPGKLRHRDHRFEWTRVEFAAWGERVAKEYGYEVAFLPVGPEDPDVGAPSQMGVFKR